jgi:hypothetical protein
MSLISTLAKLLEKAPDNIRFSEESPRSCCIGFAACFLRLWVLRRHKLKIHFAKLSGQQNSRSRSCYKTVQEQRTLNTAAKKRAGQQDVDSDYLFGSFLAALLQRQSGPKLAARNRSRKTLSPAFLDMR